jgi:hypothetical protein
MEDVGTRLGERKTECKVIIGKPEVRRTRGC